MVTQTKPLSRLQELRQRLNLPGRIEQAGIEYRRKPTQKTLLRLVRADPYQDKVVLEMADFIASCRRDYRCGLSVCRNCGRRMKQAEIKANLKSIIAAIGERPKLDQLALVTVNYSAVDPLSDSDCQLTEGAFRRSLQNAFTRRLPEYKVIGHSDVSDDLILHKHLLVWAMDMNRDHLAAELRKVFTDNRAVCVSDWWGLERHTQKNRIRVRNGEISLDDLNVTEVASYSIKVLPDVKMNSDGRLIRGEGISAVVGLRFLALQKIRRNGLRGGRTQIGIRNAEWKWKRDLLVHKVTGEYRRIRMITELMRRKRTGQTNGYIDQKRLERGWKRVEMGRYVPLTDVGDEYMDRETGEIVTLKARPSAEPQTQPEQFRSTAFHLLPKRIKLTSSSS